MICNAEVIDNYMDYIAALPSTTSVSVPLLALTITACSPKPGPSQEYTTTKKAQKRPSPLQQCYFPSKKMLKKAGNINMTEEVAMLLKVKKDVAVGITQLQLHQMKMERMKLEMEKTKLEA